MLKLKSCPRCKGDVLLDRDQYGWYHYCLQCGYVCDLVEIQQPRIQEEKKKLSGLRKRGKG